MIEHTHDKSHWVTVYGRCAQFIMRPPSTNNKGYRNPIIVKTKWFKTKAEAMAAKQAYEGLQ